VQAEQGPERAVRGRYRRWWRDQRGAVRCSFGEYPNRGGLHPELTIGGFRGHKALSKRNAQKRAITF